MATNQTPEKEALDRERLEVLEQVEDWLEWPVIFLGFVWLVLLVVELTWGLSPFLESLVNVIWIIFVIDFAIRFVLAPRKLVYLRSNWLTALSLALPALRVLRIARLAQVLRAARAARGLRLFRVVASLNRGMRTLRRSLDRHGFGYVIGLTLLVTIVGSAGVLAFESEFAGGGLDSYGEALWWTAMLITTIGSEYWPVTAEGRILALLIALYSFGVFGYVTAALASFFIGQDAASKESEAVANPSVQALQSEIRALRAEVRLLGGQPPTGEEGGAAGD